MNINASAPGTGTAGGLISTALGKNYTGGINALVPFKGNYYNSLQTQITRRFGNGSQAGFVWTWSKAIDYQGNEELSSLKFPYPANWDKDRAVADFDRTHNFKVYGTLLLPFGKGQQWAKDGWASRILGGFQLNPILSLPYRTALHSNFGRQFECEWFNTDSRSGWAIQCY